MQKDTPLTSNTLESDGILGDNLELLVLHQAYLDLFENDEDGKENKKDANKD